MENNYYPVLTTKNTNQNSKSSNDSVIIKEHGDIDNALFNYIGHLKEFKLIDENKNYLELLIRSGLQKLCNFSYLRYQDLIDNNIEFRIHKRKELYHLIIKILNEQGFCPLTKGMNDLRSVDQLIADNREVIIEKVKIEEPKKEAVIVNKGVTPEDIFILAKNGDIEKLMLEISNGFCKHDDVLKLMCESNLYNAGELYMDLIGWRKEDFIIECINKGLKEMSQFCFFMNPKNTKEAKSLFNEKFESSKTNRFPTIEEGFSLRDRIDYLNRDLLFACQNGDCKDIKNICSRGNVDLNKGLLKACNANKTEAVRLLIDLGARNFEEALIMCSKTGNVGPYEAIAYLCDKTSIEKSLKCASKRKDHNMIMVANSYLERLQDIKKYKKINSVEKYFDNYL